MSTEMPECPSTVRRPLTAIHRHHPPWRLLIAVGLLVVLASWYILTVDAIRNDPLEKIGLGVPLTAEDVEDRISYTTYFWKNTSLLPITILGVEPINMPSDWRFSEIRLGTLAIDGDALRKTKPFVPQHLFPGEVAQVVIVYEALPCDSPRLADGEVSGPMRFRTVYSIFGVHRSYTDRSVEYSGSLTMIVDGEQRLPGCPAP